MSLLLLTYLCALMRNKIVLPVLFGGIIALSLFGGCRSEYEKIRSGGDPELIYKKSFEYYDKKDFVKAQGLMELILPVYRGKKEAEEIFYRYSYTYYHNRQYLLASYYFNTFTQTFGGSPYKEEAAFMSAYSNYMLSPTFRLDQTHTLKAIDDLQLFINSYPESERVAESNRLIDELRAKLERKAFEEGKLYFDVRNYQSSVHAFENLLRDFPETGNAENVRYMIMRASYLLAENSIIEKQGDRFAETLERAEEFLARFPNSANSKEVVQMKETSIKKIKQLENVGYQSKSSRAGT